MAFFGEPGAWEYEPQIQFYFVISTIAFQNTNEKWLLNFVLSKQYCTQTDVL